MICKICGKTLPDNYSKDICRNCLRRGYAIKIVNILLNHVDIGIEFKKEDLTSLGYNPLEVNDYIWTLIEYDLLIEKDEKYRLEKRKIIDEFIKENSHISAEFNIISDIEKGEKTKDNKTVGSEKSIKLNKICLICNENLPIHNFAISTKTDDGLSKYCKKCSKKINIVKYLNKLLSIINYEEHFSFDDVKKDYIDYFEFNQHIWSLQENDLLIEENNSYVLENETKIREFLDKYEKFVDDNSLSYIESSIKKFNEIKKRNSHNNFYSENIKNKTEKCQRKVY